MFYQQFGHNQASPSRLLDFYRSRQALLMALKSAGIQSSWDQLLLKSFHQLAKFPEFSCSLSHTQGAAVAALSSSKRRVGIDVEPKNRPLKKQIHEKFLHPHDSSGYSPLELWVLKEACYKITQISALQTIISPESFQAESLQGSVQLLRHQDYLIGIALSSC